MIVGRCKIGKGLILGIIIILILIGVILYIMLYVINGTVVSAHMAVNARDGMFAGHVLQKASWENNIRLHPMTVLLQIMAKVISGFSSSSRLSIQQTNHQSGFDSLSSSAPSLSSSGHGISWSTSDFINAHEAVKNSGKYNFEGCKIPIPTTIRYDWMEKALGS